MNNNKRFTLKPIGISKIKTFKNSFAWKSINYMYLRWVI